MARGPPATNRSVQPGLRVAVTCQNVMRLIFGVCCSKASLQKCRWQHLIPAWGESRTFSFNLKGHTGVYPRDGGPSQAEKLEKSQPQGSSQTKAPTEEEPPCREWLRTSWPLQGDPEEPAVVGPPSAPGHGFCRTRTSAPIPVSVHVLNRN